MDLSEDNLHINHDNIISLGRILVISLWICIYRRVGFYALVEVFALPVPL